MMWLFFDSEFTRSNSVHMSLEQINLVYTLLHSQDSSLRMLFDDPTYDDNVLLVPFIVSQLVCTWIILSVLD